MLTIINERTRPRDNVAVHFLIKCHSLHIFLIQSYNDNAMSFDVRVFEFQHVLLL